MEYIEREPRFISCTEQYRGSEYLWQMYFQWSSGNGSRKTKDTVAKAEEKTEEKYSESFALFLMEKNI